MEAGVQDENAGDGRSPAARCCWGGVGGAEEAVEGEDDGDENAEDEDAGGENAEDEDAGGENAEDGGTGDENADGLPLSNDSQKGNVQSSVSPGTPSRSSDMVIAGASGAAGIVRSGIDGVGGVEGGMNNGCCAGSGVSLSGDM